MFIPQTAAVYEPPEAVRALEEFFSLTSGKYVSWGLWSLTRSGLAISNWEIWRELARIQPCFSSNIRDQHLITARLLSAPSCGACNRTDFVRFSMSSWRGTLLLF